MANINPGPAVTSNASATAVLAPAFTPNFGNLYQGLNALRLLTSFRAVPLSSTGDAALSPIINALSYNAATIVITNGLVNGASASIATASAGIFTGAAGTGTAVKAQATLASNTAATVVATAAAASVASSLTATGLYLNVGTALAGATVDIFVYGYDLT